MALINNYYVHVIEENVTSGIESTTHPVEKGLDITDTIRKTPKEISLTGKIVKVGSIPANAIVVGLENLMQNGSLVKYIGRNSVVNMQIQSFNHSHSNTIAGGCDFDMTLRVVRIAQPSYKSTSTKSNNNTNKTSTTPKSTSIKTGDVVIFTGGNVLSSTASQPAANRGKSTCKVTIINTLSLIHI